MKPTWLTILTLLILTNGVVALAQDLPEPELNVSLVAYQCRFQRESNSALIRATLQGADGLPISRDAYTITVTDVGSSEVVSGQFVEASPVLERPPLQMVLLLDITNTVPIDPVVAAIESDLIPRLQVEDRLALITFAEEPSPRTGFYTDKNRLLNEHMFDLRVLEGDNRIYDALYEAVAAFPIGDDTRQVVLVVSDSGRRLDNQRTVDEIITRAKRENVQVYTVGFNSGADAPDVPDLSAIANATGGYVWIWDSLIITRDALQSGVASLLADAVVTLNSEIAVEVDLTELEPASNGFITFTVTAVTNNEETASTEIACPVEALSHSITFSDEIEGGTVRGTVDIAVEVITDLERAEVVPVFLVNNEVVQDNGDTVFRFNQPLVQPGYYTVGAQLLSRGGEVLATTPRALEFYVQGDVTLDVANVAQGGYFGELSGESRFVVQTDPSFSLPPVRFLLAEKINPNDQRQIGDPVPFVDGVAVKVIANIRETIELLFPETGQENFVITAVVTGVSEDDPAQATSTEFDVYVPKAAPPPPTNTTVIPLSLLNFRYVPWGLVMVFVLLNVLLFRSIGRSRVRRMIARPDDYELPAQLMMITLRREGVKQQHSLTKKTITIGRGSSNDINLGDDPNISRQHGVVMWRRGAWYYSNHKRRAIAHINGKRRIGYTWQRLVPITELEVGNTLLIFHSSAQQDVTELVKTNI